MAAQMVAAAKSAYHCTQSPDLPWQGRPSQSAITVRAHTACKGWGGLLLAQACLCPHACNCYHTLPVPWEAWALLWRIGTTLKDGKQNFVPSATACRQQCANLTGCAPGVGAVGIGALLPPLRYPSLHYHHPALQLQPVDLLWQCKRLLKWRQWLV